MRFRENLKSVLSEKTILKLSLNIPSLILAASINLLGSVIKFMRKKEIILPTKSTEIKIANYAPLKFLAIIAPKKGTNILAKF